MYEAFDLIIIRSKTSTVPLYNGVCIRHYEVLVGSLARLGLGPGSGRGR